ncbi:Uma2 family endonuclease [Streptomyces sp. Tu 3180]|uniref:Uma2 family endonuclease n=1 Tax=Streptomyces sp. Tu 3180 TaxID=2682611 RepID=UPI001358A66F|nr:Uma2 family endonuclease [Streptomyces sp. Tu 3180]KAF3465871.1 Uma2 family endonuclease [Streptomyces sp. Tu 3180]
MTAESAEHRRPWPVPPVGGCTVDDLFALPGLPPHTELIGGSLVLVSPQRNFPADVTGLPVSGLRHSVPKKFRVKREMTIVLDRRNEPEPEVSVVFADAVRGPDRTSCRAQDVVPAVEVVSPDSESRDRTTEPYECGTAGIPHFRRVERDGTDREPLVHVHELGPVTQSRVHMGMHRDRIEVDEPSTVAIDPGPVEARS